MKEINVLSLFDGMSCGRTALKNINVKVGKYYASEIDSYSENVSRFNYPDIVRLGDVTKWREWGIDWSSIDLIMAGSPCQGFSFAGKQLAFNDPRSALFFEFVNILNHIKSVNPNVKFMLENVRMKQQFQDVITGLLGQDNVMINSSLVSAQNRVRLYWANWEFVQPEDLGIVLADILQGDNDVGAKYYYDKPFTVHETSINKNTTNKVATLEIKGHDCLKRAYSQDGKAPTVTSCGGGNTEPKVLRVRDKSCTVRVGGRNSPIGSKQCWDSPYKVLKINKKGNLKQNQDKASCLTGGGHSGGNHSDMDIIAKCGAQRGRYIDKTAKTEQKFEIRGDDKTNCLTTVQKDNLIIKDDFFIRRLTPVECERLQTLPDNYTQFGTNNSGKTVKISNMQRYKMLGNGWTVAVIEHILKGLYNE